MERRACRGCIRPRRPTTRRHTRVTETGRRPQRTWTRFHACGTACSPYCRYPLTRAWEEQGIRSREGIGDPNNGQPLCLTITRDTYASQRRSQRISEKLEEDSAMTANTVGQRADADDVRCRPGADFVDALVAQVEKLLPTARAVRNVKSQSVPIELEQFKRTRVMSSRVRRGCRIQKAQADESGRHRLRPTVSPPELRRVTVGAICQCECLSKRNEFKSGGHVGHHMMQR